jgi:hypothetical protein
MNWQSIWQAQRYEMSPIAGTTNGLAIRRKLSRRDIRSCKPTGVLLRFPAAASRFCNGLVTGGQTLPNDPRRCSNSKMSPNPRPNEVLIKVGAAGINRADLRQRQALNPLPLREGNVLIKINVVTERLGKPRWAPAGPRFAPPVGIEPTTDRLEGCCSIL